MIRIKNETVAPRDSELKKAVAGFRQLLQREDLGFFKTPERDSLWTESLKRAQELRTQYSHMVVLGIGGSSLGARALKEAFDIKNVDFFENVDGLDFWGRLRQLPDLSKTCWVVISKSGQTIETLGQASFVSEFLKERGLSFEKSASIITERRPNPLFNWANENEIPVLEVPLDIGGRFSVLTPVGLLPAAFGGVDLENLRRGSRWALTQEDLIARLVAQTLQSWERKEWITLFWVYSNRLLCFGLWIQQLWAESLAKKKDRKGHPGPMVSTPIPLLGANDQHSVLQMVAEGARDKFIWFMRLKEAENFGVTLKKSLFPHQKYLEGKTLGALLAAEAQATAQALAQNEVQSLTLEVEALTPESFGALFMLYELIVGTLGEVLDINAFDQPGVELGKRLALDLLK